MTYEEVARVANDLKGSTGKATVRDVWSRVGGDYNAVTEYMRTWRQQQPTGSAGVPPEISPTIVKALRDELAHHRGQAVAEKVSELEEAREEIEDLMREVRQFRAEREELRAQVNVISAERERLMVQVSEAASRIESLQAQAEAERRAAESARMEVAQVRVTGAKDAEHVATMRSECEAQRAVLEHERARRVESERATAAASAALNALEGRVADLIGRLQAMDAERHGLLGELQGERQQRTTAERERDVAIERAVGALARLDDLKAHDAETRLRLAERGGGKRRGMSLIQSKAKPTGETGFSGGAGQS